MPAHIALPPPPRRTGALGRHAAQRAVAALPAAAIANKYRVLDDICIAKDRVGLKDGSIAVLRALVSFHPEDTLRVGEPLVVHPSNRLLQARANGMAEATLRRHLSILVTAGILLRRDSPNGKRYVREGGEGREMYGFDLSLLIARAAEFEALREAVEAAARERRRRLDLVTIHRRDLREIVTEALAADLPGDWTGVGEALRDLSAERADRLPEAGLTALIAALEALALMANGLLEAASGVDLVTIFQTSSANDARNERHQSKSNPQPKDLEPGFQKPSGEGATTDNPPRSERSTRPVPTRLIVETFPAIRDYGRGGAVDTVDELIAAAEIARSALGISPSAQAAAVEAMGCFEAAVAIAFILAHHETIRSPGGYLRALTDRAGEGAFSAWALVLSTAKRRAGRVSPLRQRS